MRIYASNVLASACLLAAFLFLPAATFASPDTPEQRAGEVSRVIPAVCITRGGQSIAADSKAPIEFHDLACAPGPRVFKVQAAASALQRWTHYPGKTLEVEITPAFGWLDVVIAPFVPKIRAWFNPADDWNFVGGQFTRYYKGPPIMLVKKRLDGHDGTRSVK